MRFRRGGPALRATQRYPLPFGLKLATLHAEHAATAPVGLVDLAVDSIDGDVTDTWHDADLLGLHGFLRREFAAKPWY